MNEKTIKARHEISLILRRWCGNLYLQGDFVSDRQLADWVGITPTAFSRLVNATTTCSFVTYRSIVAAMCKTIGIEKTEKEIKACYRLVYEED